MDITKRKSLINLHKMVNHCVHVRKHVTDMEVCESWRVTIPLRANGGL